MRIISWSICLAIASLFFVLGAEPSDVVALREKAEKESIFNSSLVRVIMYYDSIWYIVNSNTISSEPDGNGQVVKLKEEIKPREVNNKIIFPEKNRRIRFYSNYGDFYPDFPPDYDTAYTVVGGKLSYYYVD